MQLLQNDVDTLKCENDIRQQNIKAFFLLAMTNTFKVSYFPQKRLEINFFMNSFYLFYEITLI